MSNLTLDRPTITRPTSVRTRRSVVGTYTGTASGLGSYTGTASAIGTYTGRAPQAVGSYVRTQR